MKRFVEGEDRSQSTLFSERLDDYVCEDNPGRVVDIFVDELDLGDLGFNRIEPLATGRPSYHPTDLMKLYIYCYLNRVQSSRRLEREAGHNVKVMWLGASFEAFDDHHGATTGWTWIAGRRMMPKAASRMIDPGSRLLTL